MQKWIVMLAVMLGACRASGQDSARIALLESRIAALEQAAATSARPDTAVNRNRELLDTEVIKAIFRREEYYEGMLHRLDGVVDRLGGGLLRGWWCGGDICGRTRKECVDISQLTMSITGPQNDGSGCTAVARVWCKTLDSYRLHCSPTPCADCTVAE